MEIYCTWFISNEKMMFLPFLIATPILFFRWMYGLLYCNTISLGFFISFQITGVDGFLPIELEPRILEYLSLVMKLIFAFGICFELPVLLLLLTKSGIMTPQDLANKRKYAILISFVVAAILTPPDVISQVLLALPRLFYTNFQFYYLKSIIKNKIRDDYARIKFIRDNPKIFDKKMNKRNVEISSENILKIDKNRELISNLQIFQKKEIHYQKNWNSYKGWKRCC